MNFFYMCLPEIMRLLIIDPTIKIKFTNIILSVSLDLLIEFVPAKVIWSM